MDGGSQNCIGGGDQTHLKEKEMQEGKVVSDEALQIAEKKKRRERRKGKIYPLNAEFQRIASGDKKAYLCEECKEMEEYSRKGKSRDLF